MLYVTFHPTNRADNIAVLRQLRTHDTSRVPHFWRVNARKTARIKLGYYTLPREDGKRSQVGDGGGELVTDLVELFFLWVTSSSRIFEKVSDDLLNGGENVA